VPADAAERFVVEHLASYRTPAAVVARMRDELRALRHVPDEGLRAQRQRLEVAMKRLGDRYTWQELDQAEHRSERRKLE
jgi:predicted alpha/beta-hydrolase family hydrolase